MNGLTPEEVNRREAEYSLRCSGMQDRQSFGSDEGILDLACGNGPHAFVMDDLMERQVAIRGLDRSEQPIRLANERRSRLPETGLREFLVADMKTVNPETIDPGIRCKLITIFGKSFIYGNIRETREQLGNFFHALVPGGALVLQSRVNRICQSELQRREVERTVEDSRRSLNMEMKLCTTPRGQQTFLHCDTATGDYCYKEFLHVEGPPDPERPDEYSEQLLQFEDGSSVRIWEHRETGILFYSFRRVYKNETEHELEPTLANTFLTEEHYPAAEKLLKEAGFGTVRFHVSEADTDHLGTQQISSIVAKV